MLSNELRFNWLWHRFKVENSDDTQKVPINMVSIEDNTQWYLCTDVVFLFTHRLSNANSHEFYSMLNGNVGKTSHKRLYISK